MKLANLEVTDIKLFDVDGRLLVEADTLRESRIVKQDGIYYLQIKDAVLNTDIFNLLGTEVSKQSDYDKELNGSVKSVSFGGTGGFNCKLICEGSLTDINDESDKAFKIEVPNAELLDGLDVEFRNDISTNFDYMFMFKTINDESMDAFVFHLIG